MNQLVKVAIASFVAPASFPIFLIVIGFFLWLLGEPSYKLYFINAAWIFTVALPSMFFFGLPAYAIAQSRGIIRLNRYLLGGLVLGMMIALTLSLVFPFGYKLIQAIFWSAGIGLLSAFVFWFIAIRKTKINGVRLN